MRRRGAGPLLAVMAAALAGGLSGCGTAGPAYPPTGVDGLVIPTPSPRPVDFVAGVDNPWLGWEPGAVLDYRTSDGTARVRVGDRPTEVAGLAATTVTTTVSPADEPASTSTDYFAEDRAGNVWWLGREGEWRAGEAGAEAGLWLAADPRRGDGYRLASAPGVSLEVAEVEEAPPAEDPADDDPVRVAVRSPLRPGRDEERTYTRAQGLTRLVVTSPGAAPDVWTREP